MSYLLIIREVQSETTTRNHHTPVTMSIVKNLTNNKRLRGCAEKRTLLHRWWEWQLGVAIKEDSVKVPETMKMKLEYSLTIYTHQKTPNTLKI